MIHAVETLHAGLYRPLVARIHQHVPELDTSVLIRTFVLATAGEERIEHVIGGTGGLRCDLRLVTTKLEPRFMNDGLGENGRLTHLEFHVAGSTSGRAIL